MGQSESLRTRISWIFHAKPNVLSVRTQHRVHTKILHVEQPTKLSWFVPTTTTAAATTAAAATAVTTATAVCSADVLRIAQMARSTRTRVLRLLRMDRRFCDVDVYERNELASCESQVPVDGRAPVHTRRARYGCKQYRMRMEQRHGVVK